jgi:hypothetical protein
LEPAAGEDLLNFESAGGTDFPAEAGSGQLEWESGSRVPSEELKGPGDYYI